MAEVSTRTVERALALLGVVCDRGSATLAVCARDTDLPASTALRLLRTLEASAFLVRTPEGDFRPGSRLVQLGALSLSKESLVTTCLPAMEEVVARTGESTYLSVPGHLSHALYVAIVEGTHSVRHTSWVGRTVPYEGSAVGAVLQGTTGPEGYVIVSRGVERDVTAVAAPLTSAGRVVAALSVVVPDYRAKGGVVIAIGARLDRTARSLSAELGGHAPRTPPSGAPQ